MSDGYLIAADAVSDASVMATTLQLTTTTSTTGQRVHDILELLFLIVEHATPRQAITLQRISKSFQAAARTVLRDPTNEELSSKTPR